MVQFQACFCHGHGQAAASAAAAAVAGLPLAGAEKGVLMSTYARSSSWLREDSRRAPAKLRKAAAWRFEWSSAALEAFISRPAKVPELLPGTDQAPAIYACDLHKKCLLTLDRNCLLVELLVF